MSRKTEKKHSELIDELEEKVKKNYTVMIRERTVFDVDTGRVIGEIDLAGIIGTTWDVYEVKVNDSPVKAARQLRKLRKYLMDCGSIRLYYYSGRKREIKEIE